MVFDNDLLFTFSDDPITADLASPGINIRKTPVRGEAVRVVIDAITAGDSVVFEVQASTSGADTPSDYVTIAQSAPITATGEYVIPFATKYEWVRLNANVTVVAASDATLSVVAAGIVEPDTGRNLDRTVNWS